MITSFGTFRRRNVVQLSSMRCYRRSLSSLTKTSNTTTQLLYELNKKISHLIRTGKLIEARAFFDSIKHRNTVTWNSMITGYVMRREIAKARQLFDEMPQKDIVSWNLIISGYFSCRGSRFVEEGRKLFDQMPHKDSVSWNTVISGYAKNGRMDQALKLFNQMPQRNIVSSNAMITGFLLNGDVDSAVALFNTMPERDSASLSALISGLVRNGQLSMAARILHEYGSRDDGKGNLVHAYNTLLAGYGQRGMVKEARQLFDQMPHKDSVSWNTVISGYAKNGRMDQALKLFNQMPQRNIVSSNAMITGFLLNGDVDSAVALFNTMPEHDSASLSALISGLVRNGQLSMAARILHEYGSRDDGKGNLVHAYNTLLAGYGQRGMVKEARQLFDGIPSDQRVGIEDKKRFMRNVVSWNSMMMCYVKAGDIVSARELFDRMMELDACSWNTMISGYVQTSDMEEASKLFSKMPCPDELSWNSIVSGFTQVGDLKLAREFFERMPCKNLISWNSVIAGYEKNEDYEGAVELFSRMQLEGERPDRHTLSSVLSVCTGLVDLCLGKQIHQLVTKIVIADLPINNSLITMYSRCGAIGDACTVFNEMKLYKDVITWNAMIGGYAFHGLAADALELFKYMKRFKIQPTYITFISVLNACAHAGLVEEGKRQFNSMITDYGIEPRVEHFASLVDILGRQGQLHEAMDLINSMPVKPGKAVWGALLSACRVHNNVEFAQVAAKALFSLEPDSSAPYVLLYNIYANLGRWDEAERVRLLREENNVKKEIGYSWVDSASHEY